MKGTSKAPALKRSCARCNASNDAKAAFCTSCGATMPTEAQAEGAHPSSSPPPPTDVTARSRPTWLPAALIAGAAAVMLLVVASLLLLLGGDDSEPVAAPVAASPKDVRLAERGVYAPVSADGYSALVPAGWKTAKPSGPLKLTNAVEVRSTQDQAVRVTVGQPTRPASSAGRLASEVRDQVRDDEGYDQTFFGAIRFPGKRPAWRLSYVSDGAERVVYAFSICDRQYLVTGLAPADQAPEARVRFGLTASTLQVLC